MGNRVTARWVCVPDASGRLRPSMVWSGWLDLTPELFERELSAAGLVHQPARPDS